MTQYIMLKPVIPSPTQSLEMIRSSLPNTGICSGRALDILSKNQACHVRQGDEMESEILKTLVSTGTVGKHQRTALECVEFKAIE